MAENNNVPTENAQTQNVAETAKSAEKVETKTAEKNSEKNARTLEPKTEKKSSSGKGLAVLAILISIGLGGAGYYFGQQQSLALQQKIAELSQQVQNQPASQSAEKLDLSQEHQQLAQLNSASTNNANKLLELENQLNQKDQALSALQAQVNKLGSSKSEQPTDWLLSEADFLLSNALRKLILDNDVDTSISLLKVADEVLVKVNDPRVIPVRTALNNDLKQLLSLNNVDQNAIMQRLSQLANSIDELSLLNVNFGDQEQNSTEPSDSISDWKTNLKKSASSFLDHFVRITPRNASSAKPLLAPNQDIYLRENIRLRLQIAILAVPRQQDELYKQSLESVSSWVRSYFDTSTQTASEFLKEIDELADKSIYVDVPDQLTSLKALDELLNRQTPEVKKIEISADKALTQNEAPNETPKAEENPAQETKASDPKTETETEPKASEPAPAPTAEPAQTTEQPTEQQ